MASLRNFMYAGVAAAVSFLGVARYTDVLDGNVSVRLDDSRVLNINTSNLVKLLEPKCALRARKISNEHFGKEFPPGNAWDLKYLDDVVDHGDDLRLEELISQKKLSPGMLIGMCNPQSRYLDGVDMHGEKREFTHVVVYLGQKDGKGLYAHQYAGEIAVVTESGLRALGLTPVSSFDVKPQN